jgi:hypothetical protein
MPCTWKLWFTGDSFLDDGVHSLNLATMVR